MNVKGYGFDPLGSIKQGKHTVQCYFKRVKGPEKSASRNLVLRNGLVMPGVPEGWLNMLQRLPYLDIKAVIVHV